MHLVYVPTDMATTMVDKPVMTVQRALGLMTHRHSVSVAFGHPLMHCIVQEGMVERHVKALKSLANSNKQGFVSSKNI